eukprot:GFUD01100924.1.p2 GENE.GFUD01100924.1~~GFUD01100924.1.p2  ORF type:complete len:111 (+),score=31.56 GFUD01100924.1:42-374(+)
MGDGPGECASVSDGAVDGVGDGTGICVVKEGDDRGDFVVDVVFVVKEGYGEFDVKGVCKVEEGGGTYDSIGDLVFKVVFVVKESDGRGDVGEFVVDAFTAVKEEDDESVR